MNLYELNESWMQVQKMIEDGQEGLEDTLHSILDAIEDKADGYAKVIRNIEAQAQAIKEEEKRLSNRRKSLENNVKRMKKSLEEVMIQHDKRRIKTDLFTFNIQDNPASVKVIDEDKIPKEYLIEQAPKIDKRAILKDLKEDKKISGVEINQTESLRIR